MVVPRQRVTELRDEDVAAEARRLPHGVIEVGAVHERAERRDAACLVAVDVVERAAGVEPGLPAEPDAVREPSERAHAKP